MGNASSGTGFDVEFFEDERGRKPAADFLKNTKDAAVVSTVTKKLDQIREHGLTGGEKPLGPHAMRLSELRIFQPPVRIYFLKKPNGIVVLGINFKGSHEDQTKDVKNCVARRDEYEARQKKQKPAEEWRQAAQMLNAAKAARPAAPQHGRAAHHTPH